MMTTRREREIESFRENGFVVVPDLLAVDAIEDFGQAVDEAVQARTRFDDRSLDEKTRYEQSFQQCLNLWEDHEEVRRLTFHRDIAQCAAQLLGVAAVRVWHDQALYKAAGGRVTDPHQDHPYWAINEARTVTAWIPFQDVDERNGALGYFAGSHRSGLAAFADIFTGRGLDVSSQPELAGQEATYMDVPAGAVAFHHGLTVHRARPNTSPHPRRVHTIIYFADGCTRQDQPHPSVDRPGIAVGDLIDSDLTPIAWPRATGDCPEPPAPPDPPIRGWAGWRATPDEIRRGAAKLRKLERD